MGLLVVSCPCLRQRLPAPDPHVEPCALSRLEGAHTDCRGILQVSSGDTDARGTQHTSSVRSPGQDCGGFSVDYVDMANKVLADRCRDKVDVESREEQRDERLELGARNLLAFALHVKV